MMLAHGSVARRTSFVRRIPAALAARRLPLALAALLLLACPDPRPGRVVMPADPADGEVQLEFAGPNDAALIVPVHINGEGPFDFVLDTGATLTCLSHATANQLALEAHPGAVGFGAGVGGAGRFEVVRIDSLRVGGVEAHDLLGCKLDLTQFHAIGTPIDGLLGLNFLREFRVTLDFERNTLLLERP
jgi:predicted aspartyl protease